MIYATVKAATKSIKPSKKLLTLTPNAVKRLIELQKPNELVRINVKNRGCSGLTYTLDYTKDKGKFDELVEQDGKQNSGIQPGVKVLIDSKAIFSVVGSEIDFVEDKLSSQFVFNNPNVKGSCGCGQSFMV
ncbi:hypothetical protein ROZALSC1DRAFT_28829 [Rozella allomycis CSF55]|uniref:Iron-sulfur assembly protein 1 n=1 Tax=Rozella allomycis (strain CSF55) TaxID=988480 RepID=A0A075AV07_ROZAC|nr:FeS cluster insertion protein domain-containing protein [Rozella allomycis CSF55]RKP19584.1 hypothetical protein ROZALSC1DRAFT_28829 [Rozella allomycis CSF55]|eukprot:EPZ32389.1 FeS cluster insertion protein domain-containing protein [Rozella allomycis CSF55]